MLLELSAPPMTTTNGSIQVSWRLDQELIDLITGKDLHNPTLLVVAAPLGAYVDTYEVRILCPLQDGFCYVAPVTDGLHRIHAMLVWGTNKHLHNTYLDRKRSDWSTSVLQYGNDAFKRDLSQKPAHIDCNFWGLLEPDDTHEEWRAVQGHFDLDVPKECFAVPPPEWMQKLVRFWFAKSRPEDQCDFRRLFGFTLLLAPLMVLNFLARLTVTTVATLMLLKNINWKPVLQFLDYAFADTLKNFKEEHLRWPQKWEKFEDLSQAKFLQWWYNPLILTIIGVYQWSRTESLSDWVCTTLAIFSFVGVVVFVIIVGAILVALFFEGVDRVKEWRQQTSEQSVGQLNPKTITYLTSAPKEGEVTRARSWRDVPPEQRTFRLWFADLKAQVCKPFAR